MTDPKLIVKKADGTLLFDTRLITYGLVSSGYMKYIVSWSRRRFRGGNVDPAIGANWSPSADVPPGSGDALYGFTVQNARSPIAFITNGGSLNTISRNPDGSCTFFYTGASEASKFYCFDLMADNIAGRPFLKTRRADGVLTFNSLQPPLNILSSIQAPPAGPPFQGQNVDPYAGGFGTEVQSAIAGNATYRYQVDIAVPGAGEIAAHLPWSRGGTVITRIPPSFRYSHGLVEGAYGRNGGMSFVFNVAGGTPYEPLADPVVVTRFNGIVANPRPVALLISLAPLPFPYN